MLGRSLAEWPQTSVQVSQVEQLSEPKKHLLRLSDGDCPVAPWSMIAISSMLSGFLPAGHVLRTQPAGPKITLHFPCLYLCNCASALITCAIIMSRTLLPCDLT